VSSVLRVVVEAGAGNAGDADLLHEIFGEGDVFRFGSKAWIAFGEMETRYVSHDVVRAARLVDGEAEEERILRRRSRFFAYVAARPS